MKKVLKVSLNVIIWVFVVFSVVLTLVIFAATSSKDGIPTLFGKSILAIQSDSMKPLFEKGDIIIGDYLSNEQKAALEVGDVITYAVDLDDDGENEINTHRIVEKNEEDGYVYYVTKGDNAETNMVNDEKPVVYTNVLAQYKDFKIAGVGNVLTFLQKPTGFFVVIVIPLIILFLYEIYHFVMVVVSVKGKKALSAEEEDAIKEKAIEEYLKRKEKENVATGNNETSNSTVSTNQLDDTNETVER